MNIAAAVILFHPDKAVAKRLLSYAQDVNRLYILDNTEQNTKSKEAISKVLQLPHVHYVHDGENQGLSIRLNTAAGLAHEAGFDWLLTMDQDSYFPSGSFTAYLQCISAYNDKKDAAMFGVQFGHEEDWSHECAPEEVEQLITSGSVLNLSLFEKTGPFDEALFIDRVDQEYCLRARLLHYRIVRFNNISLHHNLGLTTSGISLKGFKRTPRTLHSPVRLYYMLRNYFYLKDKYNQQDHASIDFMKKELLLRIKNNLLYGKNRTSVLRYLYRGYTDYKAGRMGRINQ